MAVLCDVCVCLRAACVLRACLIDRNANAKKTKKQKTCISLFVPPQIAPSLQSQRRSIALSPLIRLGKSTLLMALLKEITPASGFVTFHRHNLLLSNSKSQSSGQKSNQKLRSNSLKAAVEYCSLNSTDSTDPSQLRIAYVAQQPWITSATVRDNITFGASFEKQWYDTT